MATSATSIDAATLDDPQPSNMPANDPIALAFHAWELYDVSQEAAQLDEAIRVTLIAIEDGHEAPDPALLLRLGWGLDTRFSATGDIEDLNLAIQMDRRAVELMHSNDPDRPSGLRNLGIGLETRYELLGNVEDLDDAIQAYQHSVALTTDNDPELPKRLSDLSDSLVKRFELLGYIEDVDLNISLLRRAIDMAPSLSTDLPMILSILGECFHQRFKHLGELEDIESAISAHRRAVDLAPELPSYLVNLGRSLYRRFARQGELGDLEEAISVQERAIILIPDENTRKPISLHNLANYYKEYFQQRGELSDLEHALSLGRRAVELTSEGNTWRPFGLSNIGISLVMRFERLGKLHDIEEAISLLRCSVDLLPDDHIDKPIVLSNLSDSLRNRFLVLGAFSDLEDSIRMARGAVDLSLDGPSEKIDYLNNLGAVLVQRFKQMGDLKDIEEAISVHYRAVEGKPDGHPDKTVLLKNLGNAWRLRFERLREKQDFDCAMDSYMTAMMQPCGDHFARLSSAEHYVSLHAAHTELSSPESLLKAYSCILGILPEIVWLGHSVNRRYTESAKLGGLLNRAVSAAIDAGKLSQAVEWLEAGRSLIWSQLIALRTPLDELQQLRPDFADSLRDIHRQLQLSSPSTFMPEPETSGGITGIGVNAMVNSHRTLVVRYERLLKDIRECKGFENFLRPKTFDSLSSSLELLSGPVVFINVHSTHCDALVLSPDASVVLVPLPDLSLDHAIKWRNLLDDRLKACGVRRRGIVQMSKSQESYICLADLLKSIWNRIVHPILQSLNISIKPPTGKPLPHITWCPTGPLTQLPLHAAGIYSDPLGPRVFDFVVSSYTPSLSAILRNCGSDVKRHPSPKVLIVTQHATPGQSPLPFTRAEASRLQRILFEVQFENEIFQHEQATVADVKTAMDKHPWVHLACHGLQHPNDPTQSAFRLYDGPLTLSALMSTAADDAELAFLSACQTATGDEKIPEESAHLAAGMLAVGFKGVVATMWSISDQDAPIVVEAYYKKLLELRCSGTLGKGETGAAYALHEATKVLREKIGEKNFMRWIPFVHFGI